MEAILSSLGNNNHDRNHIRRAIILVKPAKLVKMEGNKHCQLKRVTDTPAPLLNQLL